MKRRDLEKELRKCGWWLGGKHDIWTNGEDQGLFLVITRSTSGWLKKLSRLRMHR